MKIAIVLYSKTGNTKSVATQLLDKLIATGHNAILEEIVPVGDPTPADKTVSFSRLPDLSSYDGAIFCSPVHAFSLCVTMKYALQEMKLKENFPAATLLTQFFPYAWMGGNRAMGQFKKGVAERGGVVKREAIINWKNEKKREEQIKKCIEEFSTFL